ncbi:hypothetical protein COLO4_24460 [Corchorus olitorius]|uniref:Uncharacterized protein n=1 Tax=Corchorus olitorius TaxID=93759 RepID=A0A1R3I9U7_9ROSI|nr:hypothetical protein COLO4_24460 [Corchorus olitorius]
MAGRLSTMAKTSRQSSLVNLPSKFSSYKLP